MPDKGVSVEARLIDPRDVNEEEDTPAYRVYFWSEDAAYSEEYRIAPGVDVEDVLAWATSQDNGLIPIIYAETATAFEGLRLLRLSGWPPGMPREP